MASSLYQSSYFHISNGSRFHTNLFLDNLGVILDPQVSRFREVDRINVGRWKAIRKEWHLVSSRFFFMVGNGQRVRFWKDKWCEASPFCDSFPSLFALALSKDVWVNDMWSSADGKGSWSSHFSRPFND